MIHGYIRIGKICFSLCKKLVFLVCENMCTCRASPPHPPYIYMTWMCWTLAEYIVLVFCENVWLMTTYTRNFFLCCCYPKQFFDANKLTELSSLWAANYHGLSAPSTFVWGVGREMNVWLPGSDDKSCRIIMMLRRRRILWRLDICQSKCDDLGDGSVDLGWWIAHLCLPACDGIIERKAANNPHEICITMHSADSWPSKTIIQH